MHPKRASSIATLQRAALLAVSLCLPAGVAVASGRMAGVTDEDLSCLALNVYHEARNQPREGQLAVAHVTLNRMAESRTPATLCEVVYRPGVFSWTSDPAASAIPPAEPEAWERANQIAREAVADHRSNPVAGSTFFHAVSVEPSWAPQLVRVRQIGDHVFYTRTQMPVPASRREGRPEIRLP